MDGACSTHGRDKEFIRILFGKLGEKRPVGRPTYTSEDVLKWIHSHQTLLLA
jgi:hypothetical protein